MDLYAVQYAVPARKPKTQNKPQKQTSKNKKTTNQQQKSTNKAKTKQPKNTKKWDRYQQWGFMHDDILCVMMRMALTRSKTKNHNKNTRGQVRGCKKHQSSMQKPGVPPARIPEITKSSRSGMTFTLTLRSKHRQRRVATKVVRKERTVKQEGETWSSVKMTAKATALRAHSESTQWFFS